MLFRSSFSPVIFITAVFALRLLLCVFVVVLMLLSCNSWAFYVPLCRKEKEYVVMRMMQGSPDTSSLFTRRTSFRLRFFSLVLRSDGGERRAARMTEREASLHVFCLCVRNHLSLSRFKRAEVVWMLLKGSITTFYHPLISPQTTATKFEQMLALKKKIDINMSMQNICMNRLDKWQSWCSLSERTSCSKIIKVQSLTEMNHKGLRKKWVR